MWYENALEPLAPLGGNSENGAHCLGEALRTSQKGWYEWPVDQPERLVTPAAEWMELRRRLL